MSWRLPPLNALRAFEVAARHASFTKAADELFVTPGAISRQVRGLEDYLGRSLFDRNYREVVPNDASRIYAAELFEAFARIDRATRAFVARDVQRKLQIYAPVTFSLRWLLPRLSRYHAQFPEQGIDVASLFDPPPDLGTADVDVAVRLAGARPNEVAEPLFRVALLPVCSPSFLDKHPVAEPADLLELQLLVSEKRPADWKAWLDAKNVDGASAEVVAFSSSSMAYQAALGGAGFAIAMDAFVADDLAAGRLVAPFPGGIPIDATFHVVYAVPFESDDVVQQFVGWIREEAAATRATV
ncbi:LysR substrate-binding domain-containing protein [Acuticoccus mangrovi]|uniref:LysR family transcriptional regulator n=1 Tax=Acuticoccus mangrovi TaxID=2796142 RepID=A0A934IIG1_9HYPH|nr:LysR substrate-binding domain-containing protein [Acuticoccus mangrovi]MBJ3777078.1 LysR family transcriptional regulator [Acuticoccus mangrovi]